MDSKLLRISAWIGIAFGVFLVFGETRRNWGAWGHWANYTFDYLFAVLLVLFGYLSLKGRAWGRALLIATWTLTIALFTYSFSGHVQNLDRPTYGQVPHVELTIWIGVLDLIALVALVLAIGSFFTRPADD